MEESLPERKKPLRVPVLNFKVCFRELNEPMLLFNSRYFSFSVSNVLMLTLAPNAPVPLDEVPTPL